MNTRRRLAVALAAAALSPALVAVPSHADDDEPIPGPVTDPCGIVWRDRSIAYWKQAYLDEVEQSSARQVVILERALTAEDRVATLTADVAARTAERDRLLVQSQRWRVQRDRARATIERLRARLAATR